MGVYDIIEKRIKCKNCGIKFNASEQIKWTYEPYLKSYKIGDIIDADDGIYTYGSSVRNILYDVCPKCGFKNILSVTVKNNKVENIDVIDVKMLL